MKECCSNCKYSIENKGTYVCGEKKKILVNVHNEVKCDSFNSVRIDLQSLFTILGIKT